jgi:hypothetical protein
VGDKVPVCLGRFRGVAARYLAALFDDGSEAWYLLPPRGKLPPFPAGEVATARPDGPPVCTLVWRRHDRTKKQAAAADKFAGMPEPGTPDGRPLVRLRIDEYFVCGVWRPMTEKKSR